jgi:tetratricopeptide (TPR) repeat protein
VLAAEQARHWHDSNTLFARVLAVDPKSDVAYCNLAADALTFNRSVEAERLARRALELNPARSSNGITLGIALQRLGRHAEAGTEFLKVAKSEPGNVIALTSLADELARVGRTQQAIALCRGAIQIDPRFADAHRTLATLLERQHNYNEAVGEAAEAVRLDPSVAANHLTYGRLLDTLGRRTEAAQEFTAARAIDPEAIEPLIAPGNTDHASH